MSELSLVCPPPLENGVVIYGWPLRRHIYFKHTSLRCEECDKTFTKNVYKKHMETVHADKTNRQYQCDQCSYTSYAMKYIYDHKSMAHYNEKEPMCKTCGQKFPSKVSMQRLLTIYQLLVI